MLHYCNFLMDCGVQVVCLTIAFMLFPDDFVKAGAKDRNEAVSLRSMTRLPLLLSGYAGFREKARRRRL